MTIVNWLYSSELIVFKVVYLGREECDIDVTENSAICGTVRLFHWRLSTEWNRPQSVGVVAEGALSSDRGICTVLRSRTRRGCVSVALVGVFFEFQGGGIKRQRGQDQRGQRLPGGCAGNCRETVNSSTEDRPRLALISFGRSFYSFNYAIDKTPSSSLGSGACGRMVPYRGAVPCSVSSSLPFMERSTFLPLQAILFSSLFRVSWTIL